MVVNSQKNRVISKINFILTTNLQKIMPQVTKSFYENITTVVAIFVAGYFMNSNLITSMEKIIQPVSDRVLVLEKSHSTILADISVLENRSKANSKCIDNMTMFLNKTFNKEFVKPEEIYFSTSKFKEDDKIN